MQYLELVELIAKTTGGPGLPIHVSSYSSSCSSWVERVLWLHALETAYQSCRANMLLHEAILQASEALSQLTSELVDQVEFLDLVRPKT